jgi:hypothetical protein
MVTIDAAKQYQRIAGFGVSEGFGQARTLMNTPVSVQKQVLSLLYSPTRGAGLTILRNEICADKGFTIEPRAPSPNDKPSYLRLAPLMTASCFIQAPRARPSEPTIASIAAPAGGPRSQWRRKAIPDGARAGPRRTIGRARTRAPAPTSPAFSSRPET